MWLSAVAGDSPPCCVQELGVDSVTQTPHSRALWPAWSRVPTVTQGPSPESRYPYLSEFWKLRIRKRSPCAKEGDLTRLRHPIGHPIGCWVFTMWPVWTEAHCEYKIHTGFQGLSMKKSFSWCTLHISYLIWSDLMKKSNYLLCWLCWWNGNILAKLG